MAVALVALDRPGSGLAASAGRMIQAADLRVERNDVRYPSGGKLCYPREAALAAGT